MTLYSSSRFASAAATGSDWQEAARRVLADLLPAAAGKTHGFLYITETLQADVTAILDFMRSATGASHWVGMAAPAVCGCDGRLADEPAIAVLLGQFAEQDICLSPARSLDTQEADAALGQWLGANMAQLVLVHGAPGPETDIAKRIAAIERRTGGYVVGGLAAGGSSRERPATLIADHIDTAGFSGAVMGAGLALATGLTQGCAPLGPLRRITLLAGDNVIGQLDGRRASDIFAEDMKALAAPLAGSAKPGMLYKGEVHAAFPVEGSDQGAYVVCEALGIDAERGALVVGQDIQVGDSLLFVRRDAETMRADLARMLLSLRARVTRDHGAFTPQGALYITGQGRAEIAEMEVLRDVIGDVPLAGFQAAGEIAGARLYSHSAVLILFL